MKVYSNSTNEIYSDFLHDFVQNQNKRITPAILTPANSSFKDLPVSKVMEPGTDHFIEMQLSDEQLNAINEIENCSEDIIILTGRAGAGKSTIVNSLRHRHPNWGVCSTTGKSACLIGGKTLDNFFGYDRGTRRRHHKVDEARLAERLDGIPVTIIDEASMVGEYMFNYLKKTASEFRMKLLLVGDWGQAAPVKENWFFSKVKSGFKFIKLNECHRQANSEFLTCLDKLRLGIQDDQVNKLFRSRINEQLPENDETALILLPYNAQVDAYNDYKLQQLLDEQVAQNGRHLGFNLKAYFDGEPNTMKARLQPKNVVEENFLKECPLANNDRFCIGAKVILTLNNWEVGYVNGDTGTITGIIKYANVPKASGIRVVLDRTHQEVIVPNVLMQCEYYWGQERRWAKLYGFPIRLGYALSIHKSQGMTIPKVWIDVEGIRNFNMHGLLYVALSRVRKIEDLEVGNWFDERMCPIDECVRKYL